MPLEGLHLGRYRLLRLLGSGGMGEVYLAEDARIGQQVAIKVIRSEGIAYPQSESAKEAARLFEREAKAIARLDHPNILPLYAYGEDMLNDTLLTYLVMPYRKEGTLASWLRQSGRAASLSPAEVAPLLQQAADALQHAHTQHVIHQDIKPSNFLIRVREDPPDRPDLLLSDFGIAKLSSATASASQSIRGTPTYMAPEQWDGHPVPATDQYALAIMVYELLVGYPPFRGGPGQVMRQHYLTPPPAPSSLNPTLPVAIDAVLLRALAKQPDERFVSVTAFARAFQEAVQRDGNLHATLAISRAEAESGTTRSLTLPGGRKVSVTVPAGVGDGATIRLEGQGMPYFEGGPAGSLVLTIVIPAQASPLPLPRDSTDPTVVVSLPNAALPSVEDARVLPARPDVPAYQEPLVPSTPSGILVPWPCGHMNRPVARFCIVCGEPASPPHSISQPSSPSVQANIFSELNSSSSSQPASLTFPRPPISSIQKGFSRRNKTILIGLVFIIVIVSIGLLSPRIVASFTHSTPSVSSHTNSTISNHPTSPNALLDIAKPAVVRIITFLNGQLMVHFPTQNVTFPQGGNGYQIVLSGSGTFITATGEILTADHVVNPPQQDLDQFLQQQAAQDVATYMNQVLKVNPPVSADQVAAQLASGQLPSDSQYSTPQSRVYLSTDYTGPLSVTDINNVPANLYAPVDRIERQSSFNDRDVAIIHVSNMNDMAMVQLGDSSSVQQQDELTIIGFPGNRDTASSNATDLLTPSVNKVFVSSIKTTNTGAPIIEVAGNVEHGYGGGPALNSNGSIVGIISFGSLGSGGTGFLQASNSVRALIQSLGLNTIPGPFQKAWSQAISDYAANNAGHWHRAEQELTQITVTYPLFKAITPYLMNAKQQAKNEQQP